jgi:hypothetical protein
MSTMEEDTSTAFMPFKVIVIKTRCCDYNKWRAAYDAHDSIRMLYEFRILLLVEGWIT